MERIELRIIDDPGNTRVYKGPGHYAATRAQTAIRRIEAAFPQIHFRVAPDQRLASLNAVALVPAPIDSTTFIDVVAEALEATGTRVAASTPLPSFS